MDWIEILVEVEADRIDDAAAIANMTVPYGIYIEDYRELEQEVMEIAHVDLIDEDLLKQDRSKAKIHIYISLEDNIGEAVQFLSERLNAASIDHKIDQSSVQEDDWLNNWRRFFKPMPVGEKLLINPSWYTDTDPEGRLMMNIDPGLAFGTGKHETTRLCMEALERYVKGGERVLDVGCGSGILGIAAVMLGAQSAFGIDIDETAVRTANENAVVNHVDDKVSAIAGDLVDKVEGTYEIVVANIVADAIIALSASVGNFMTDDAVYIISGIIDTRADDVKNAIRDHFEIIEENTHRGWYCFVLKKRNHAQ
ncbi:MAG: 50S ribosomal protein L11 methyltransferase [Ruminococcus sp.]|uniref:50S ribosomal protein L11 methyltransferase n=1 Tax=Ruminococcus sp. TaxID=41978 RepID=UPI0028738ADC|nr:50S ribosomal protein L11 methyltransferase [Ruminococcus sp.]MBQ3284436.1 50S ribosomal protein L11 methyltransferase [Ruminococcus sp.]